MRGRGAACVCVHGRRCGGAWLGRAVGMVCGDWPATLTPEPSSCRASNPRRGPGRRSGGDPRSYSEMAEDGHFDTRPRALTIQQRLEMAVAEANERHPSTWDVQDVCNWVEVIGFMQYRKKFLHNW